MQSQLLAFSDRPPAMALREKKTQRGKFPITRASSAAALSLSSSPYAFILLRGHLLPIDGDPGESKTLQRKGGIEIAQAGCTLSRLQCETSAEQRQSGGSNRRGSDCGVCSGRSNALFLVSNLRGWGEAVGWHATLSLQARTCSEVRSGCIARCKGRQE